MSDHTQRVLDFLWDGATGLVQDAFDAALQLADTIERERLTLTAELEAANRRGNIERSFCERRHSFCPDCRDKLPDNFCWRCENQRLTKEVETQQKAANHWFSEANKEHNRAENAVELCRDAMFQVPNDSGGKASLVRRLAEIEKGGK